MTASAYQLQPCHVPVENQCANPPLPVLPLQLLGLLVLCVGIYAEVERQKNKTMEGLFLAPAVLLILLGLAMFSVSLVGMLGSLRDNRTLLHIFFCVLSVLLALQTIAVIIALLFENNTSSVFQSSIREGIKHYYDDLDFKNILDFVQEKELKDTPKLVTYTLGLITLAVKPGMGETSGVLFPSLWHTNSFVFPDALSNPVKKNI
ncbi:UNVERIFIED_CONTAM: hypothetical protein FKN15_062681 [Acipenser sinensis]